MSKELTIGFFPERFTVSAVGMSDLNKDRFERLIYELAQNVFDEDSATFAAVSFYYYTGKGVRVVVKDDGSGYANPRDIYEIFGTTRSAAWLKSAVASTGVSNRSSRWQPRRRDNGGLYRGIPPRSAGVSLGEIAARRALI